MLLPPLITHLSQYNKFPWNASRKRISLFELSNDNKCSQIHQLQLYKLFDGKTLSLFAKAMRG